MRPILVVLHEDRCPPGWLGDAWSDAGWSLDIRTPYRSWDAPRQGLPADLSQHSALVILGGQMGANDDLDHPWLPTAKDLVRQAVSSQTPTLGVCLGHQVIAVALGGRVEPNPAGRATGVTPIGLTPDAANDPVLSGLDGRSVVQWNNDIITGLPAGATVLATSPDGSVQAARFAPRVWGLQFHPEAGPAIFDGWLRTSPEVTPQARTAAEDVRASQGDLHALAGVIAGRFLDQLAAPDRPADSDKREATHSVG